MKHFVLTLCTVVMLIWSNVGLASAWNTGISGDIPFNGIHYFTTWRKVHTYPWEMRR